MGHTSDLLEEVRIQIAPSEETLLAARTRRDDVLAAALKDLEGILGSYFAGSIGHRTANDDTDADCGIVLDRRSYAELGPDGDDVGPDDIVERVRTVARNNLKTEYKDLKTRITKRAITFEFHQPVGLGDAARDPGVDLIVALTRKDAEGLWIPNRTTDGWDASHPEMHTKLLTDPNDELRRLRAGTIRLVKAWNQQFVDPGLCSFNVEALALEALVAKVPIGDAVTLWFEHAARELMKANTKDPADVSKPIKLLLERDVVVSRVEGAASHMREALDHDEDEDAVKEELGIVFHKYIQPPASDSSKTAFAASLRSGNADLNRAGAYVSAAAASSRLKTVRSYGEAKIREG